MKIYFLTVPKAPQGYVFIHPDSIHKSAILNWDGLWPASKLSMGDIVSGH